jgi:phage-related protein
MTLFRRSLFRVASTKKDLMDMPEDVRDTFGYALHLAQVGGKAFEVEFTTLAVELFGEPNLIHSH